MPKENKWVNGLMLADGAEPRDEIMLFPFGTFNHAEYGEMVFDQKFFSEIIDNYESEILGQTKPFMDAKHDKGKALAWFNKPPYIRQGQGLFVKPEYTELGKKSLGEKEYMFFSPWWVPEFEEPQTKRKHTNVWKGGAATNTPFLKVMPPIVDSIKLDSDEDGSMNIMLSDIVCKSGSAKVQTPEKSKPIINKTKEADVNKKLAKILGLPEDSTEEVIEAKLSERLASIKVLEEKLVDVEKKLEEAAKPKEEKPAEKKPAGGEPEPTEKEKKLTAQVDALKLKDTERDRDTDIEKALSEGKIMPKDKEYFQERYMSDPEGVKKDIAHMHPAINMKELGGAGVTLEDEGDTAGDKVVNKARVLAEEKKISLEDAMDRVLSENPELAEEYRAGNRGKNRRL